MTAEQQMATMCRHCGAMAGVDTSGIVLSWHCNVCGASWTPYEAFPPSEEKLAAVLHDLFSEYEGQRPVALGSLYFSLQAMIKQFSLVSQSGEIRIEGRACHHFKAEYLQEALEFLYGKYGRMDGTNAA